MVSDRTHLQYHFLPHVEHWVPVGSREFCRTFRALRIARPHRIWTCMWSTDVYMFSFKLQFRAHTFQNATQQSWKYFHFSWQMFSLPNIVHISIQLVPSQLAIFIYICCDSTDDMADGGRTPRARTVLVPNVDFVCCSGACVVSTLDARVNDDPQTQKINKQAFRLAREKLAILACSMLRSYDGESAWQKNCKNCKDSDHHLHLLEEWHL